MSTLSEQVFVDFVIESEEISSFEVDDAALAAEFEKLLAAEADKENQPPVLPACAMFGMPAKAYSGHITPRVGQRTVLQDITPPRETLVHVGPRLAERPRAARNPLRQINTSARPGEQRPKREAVKENQALLNA